ncbi:MAG: hypothetical protein HY751_04295 [Nitrospinae bacterium]|nr:hypothetical protein [Nitrospinota bacterium]
MRVVDGMVAVVKPRKPFLDWLEALPDPVKGVTLAQLGEDCMTFIIPSYDSMNDALDHVYGDYEIIFELELAGWWEEESDWPKDRTLKMFKDWFAVEIHSMVYALGLDGADAEGEGV